MEIRGIDVSNHQGVIDWGKVVRSGIEFAIIRAGYGKSYIDDSFYRNIEGALAAGVKVGIYWFSYALSTSDAHEEAKKCIQTIAGYSVTLPVFFDFEAASVTYAEKQGVTVTPSDYNAFVKKFCDHIENQGYRAGVYYNLDFLRNWVDTKKLAGYVQWLAYYTTEKQTAYDLQQYSSSGSVSGISGNVDLDWLFDTTLLETDTDIDVTEKKRTEAVKELQRVLNEAYHAGLAVDGSFGPLTSQAVRAHYLYYKIPTIRNSHVRWVQEMLQTLGYEIEADGSYGPVTASTVKQFQKDNGLEVDGYAGPETHRKLIENITKGIEI